MEVLALRLTNEILVGEVMLVGKWKSDKKIYSPFSMCMYACEGYTSQKEKSPFLICYSIYAQRRRRMWWNSGKVQLVAQVSGLHCDGF